MSYASALRQELIARNATYAVNKGLSHVTSYGEFPVVVYQASECGRHHGNFISASYRAILRTPHWRKRLLKVHTQGRRSLPPTSMTDGAWHELDSSLSSDALLMNIFCYPGIPRRAEVCGILGTDTECTPEFGFRPRVPLISNFVERTEVDMRLGNALFEAKLTEGDFQTQRAELVQGYRDFRDVFETRQLPRSGRGYVSYQLIRNILAAHALGMDFCTLLDARRPDLLEEWYRVVRCIRHATLRARCKLLTWQELSGCIPRALQNFLAQKYGILAGS